jgi:hypothetical protein
MNAALGALLECAAIARAALSPQVGEGEKS